MIIRRGTFLSSGAAVVLFCPPWLGAELHPGLSPAGERRAEALALYYRGLAHEGELELAPALAAFEELLRIDPANSGVAARAAQLAAALGQHGRGLEIVGASAAANPDQVAAHLNLGRYLQRHGDKVGGGRRALEVAAAAVRRFPGEAEAIGLLVDLQVAAGDPDAARTIWERVSGREGGDAAFWLAMAEISGKLDPGGAGGEGAHRAQVRAVLDKALSAAGTDFGVADEVANHHLRGRDYARAIEVLEPLVAAHPEELLAREKLVRAYSVSGRRRSALDALRRLVRVDPNRARTQRLLAELLAEAGAYGESVRHRARAMRLGGGEIDDYTELAVLLADKCDPPQRDEALRWLRRGAAHFPSSPRLCYLEAVVLGQLGRFDEALRAYRRTEQLAESALPELLDEGFYFAFGAAAERAGEIGTAGDHFRRAVELVPEGAPGLAAKSLNYHGYMLLENGGDLGEAGAMIRRAVELDPGNPVYLDSLGWYYFKKMQYRKALVELRRADRLLGDSPDAEVLGHIAQTYEALGQPAEAQAYRERERALSE